MTRKETRLNRIENESQFRCWLRRQRIFETMTADDLEEYAITGQWIDRPGLAFGTSTLDKMDRPSLIKLWKQYMQQFAGRSSDELEFYAVNGHWPATSEILI